MMLQKVDDTIETICEQIIGILKNENIAEEKNIPELVKALAELISARKDFVNGSVK